MKNKVFYHLLLAGFLVLALCGIGNADSFVLTGNYLNVGINDAGGLISTGSHINESGFPIGVGLQFDPTGTGTFPAQGAGTDFLSPGVPFQFYSIGINGSNLGAAGYPNAYVPGNTFNMTTTNTSSGSTLSATSIGSVDGLLISSQVTYFNKSATNIHFSVDFINTTASPLSVVYANGLDPDQDLYTYGTYATNNSIGTIAGKAVVTAVGPYSGLGIQIQDYTGGGIASVNNWETNPYTLLAGGNVGNGDNQIAMAWNLGTLAPFTSKELDFSYNLSAVPLPPALLLFAPGLLGLIGIRKRFKG